jgi:hypothetical protein
MMIL